ncbi:hypothetical protein [Nonomuraea rubra]|uniref:hypothetical protein n=1 Tax=Nonomuraea rubra TaxID=46180 RepID=UPI0031EF5E8F
MTSTILIKNGVVIDTEPEPVVLGRVDVRVDGGTITAVGPGLPAEPGAEVIDATGRLVLPGFVDTHRHTWQAGIRAVAPDVDFGGYMRRIITELAPRHRPRDLYAGNLAGALECLDSGVTTLLDWSHAQFSPEHTEAAVRALRESGIRGRLRLLLRRPERRGGRGDPARPRDPVRHARPGHDGGRGHRAGDRGREARPGGVARGRRAGPAGHRAPGRARRRERRQRAGLPGGQRAAVHTRPRSCTPCTTPTSSSSASPPPAPPPRSRPWTR